MKLSELVEAKAREAATECGAGIFCTAEEFAFRVSLAKYAIIATLNECGFREALEYQKQAVDWHDVATAEAKLAELKELSK